MCLGNQGVSQAVMQIGKFMTLRANTVLVAEDESLIRMRIVGDLEDAGFTVFEAANAVAAIRLLEANPEIGLLFTEVDIPGSMDGLKLAVAVRNRWPPVRILVTSGHMRIAADDLPPGSRFFIKPYEGRTIAMALKEMALAANWNPKV
jgi:CheY-like chemotaxis protein